MSVIVIIDDRIHENLLTDNRVIHRFKYHEEQFIPIKGFYSEHYSHATLCAKMLETCGSDYEIISIQICDNILEEPVDIRVLNAALQFCLALPIDMIHMSIGTTRLSETIYLYESICALAEKQVLMIAAIDNEERYTLPASYRQVLGVSSDRLERLRPYQIVYDDEEFLSGQVIANHPNALPRLKKPLTSSNSLAVPVVAAKCNDLINQGIRSYPEIINVIKRETFSAVNGYRLWHQGKGKTEITIPHLCFVEDDSAILDKCNEILNILFTDYDYEGLCFTFGREYDDIRFRSIDFENGAFEIGFMENYTTVDLFLTVIESRNIDRIRSVVEVDVFVFAKETNCRRNTNIPCINMEQYNSLNTLCDDLIKVLL